MRPAKPASSSVTTPSSAQAIAMEYVNASWSPKHTCNPAIGVQGGMLTYKPNRNPAVCSIPSKKCGGILVNIFAAHLRTQTRGPLHTVANERRGNSLVHCSEGIHFVVCPDSSEPLHRGLNIGHKG